MSEKRIISDSRCGDGERQRERERGRKEKRIKKTERKIFIS